MLKLREENKKSQRVNFSNTESALGSDLVPITLHLTCDIENLKAKKSTSLNFRKADWLKFLEQTEELFRKAQFSGIVLKDEKC